MATLIKTDNTEIEVQPKNGTDFTLQEMYEMLNCSMVQMIETNDGQLMWMDEEGKFKPEPEANSKATEILAKSGGMFWDIVVGNVLITKLDEVK